jgi:hypothetical protein
LWLKLHDLTHPLKAQSQALQRWPRKLKPQMQKQVQMRPRVRLQALLQLVSQVPQVQV